MNPGLTISLTLCHQFKSNYYNSRELKTCITKATEGAEEMLEDINIVYEDIEEDMSDNIIHENVVNSIRKSHIVIFELSDVNSNVLYELGIANGLKKPIIIIREKNSNVTLPTDINQFIYLIYDKDKLGKFHNKLAEQIKKSIEGYDEIDFISKSIREKVLDDFIINKSDYLFDRLEKGNILNILKTKSDFSNAFKEIITSTEVNIYYIGTLGFLSKDREWFDFYLDNFNNEKIFSRIVYIQSLIEFYEIYDDIDMLIDYCIWLILNYYLVKNGIITISKSNDISIWKKGISFIIYDEKKILISTGSFQNEYNNKGFVLNNKEVASMFKEYAKILAINSKTIKARDFAQFFDLNTKSYSKKIPQEILDALDNAVLEKDFSSLREVCSNYIINSLEL